MIVRRVFKDIEQMMPSEGQIETEFVSDSETGHFQLGQVGWDGDRRIDDVYLHVDVHDGKVWIQHDGTNLRLAELFAREGIPRDSIVLGFHRPDLRVHTDFAAA